jgi:hypothetical protein
MTWSGTIFWEYRKSCSDLTDDLAEWPTAWLSQPTDQFPFAKWAYSNAFPGLGATPGPQTPPKRKSRLRRRRARSPTAAQSRSKTIRNSFWDSVLARCGPPGGRSSRGRGAADGPRSPAGTAPKNRGGQSGQSGTPIFQNCCTVAPEGIWRNNAMRRRDRRDVPRPSESERASPAYGCPAVRRAPSGNCVIGQSGNGVIEEEQSVVRFQS